METTSRRIHICCSCSLVSPSKQMPEGRKFTFKGTTTKVEDRDKIIICARKKGKTYSSGDGWWRTMCMILPGGYNGWWRVKAIELSVGCTLVVRAVSLCCVMRIKEKHNRRWKQYTLGSVYAIYVLNACKIRALFSRLECVTRKSGYKFLQLNGNYHNIYLLILVYMSILARHFNNRCWFGTTTTADHGTCYRLPLDWYDRIYLI